MVFGDLFYMYNPAETRGGLYLQAVPSEKSAEKRAVSLAHENTYWLFQHVNFIPIFGSVSFKNTYFSIERFFIVCLLFCLFMLASISI